MPSKVALVMSVLVLFLSASAVQADTLYTSASAFDAATANTTTINFTASCSTCFTDYTSYTDPGTGTAFSIATPYVNLTGSDFYGAGVYPADFLVESSTAGAVANLLTVTPPSGYNAIGFNIGSFHGSTFVVTLSDGTIFDITPPEFNGLGFFGFTSSSDIGSISLATPAGDTFVIDQAVLANTGVTPEPASIVLFGTGLLALAGLSRRRLPRWLR
jgi:PEP-CTERM motif